MSGSAQAGWFAQVRGKAARPPQAPTLAELLASGPLPLPVALAYARTIASGAAAFHRRGIALGALAPSRILVGAGGPTLAPPNGTSRLASRSSDVQNFGLLLHRMLTGCEPADRPVPDFAPGDQSAISPQTVRAAALRVAERCRNAPRKHDLRRVAIELRLLQIMINAFGPHQAAQEAPAPQTEDRPAAPAALAGPAKSRAREMACPACGSMEVFPAHRLMLLERALGIADLKTYRCHRCRERFIDLLGFHWARPENE